MQTFFLYVVCIYVFHSATSASAASAQSPLACDSNGTLTYTGIPNLVQSASADCGTAAVNTTSHTVVITGCPVGKPVTVFMYNVITTPVPRILGISTLQSEELVLTCNTTNGVYTANITFPGGVSPSTLTAIEPISLSMSLTTQGSNEKASTVVIGTKYDLHITGAGKNFMKLLTCTAAADKSKTTTVTVYDATNSADDLGVISPLTDTPASVADTHPLKATLTGFRLVKSLTVYLECSVKVCDTTHCLSQPARKRKRTKSSLKTASLKFEVIGTQSPRHANGGRDIHTAGKFSVITAVLFHQSFITLQYTDPRRG